MFGKEKTQPTGQQPRSTSSRPRPATTQPIETTIGTNTHIKGDIQGDGGLRVEGIVEGNIVITGNLVVTESAKIIAEIKASNVSIAGAVRGNIHANRLEILDTGRVWGDMAVKSLLTNEGAYLRGQTLMPQDIQPPQIESPKPKLPERPQRPQPPKPSVPALRDVTPKKQ